MHPVHVEVTKKPVTNGYWLQIGYRKWREEEHVDDKMIKKRMKTVTSGFYSRWSGTHKAMTVPSLRFTSSQYVLLIRTEWRRKGVI
jgi:hypothetical protein